MNFQNRIPQHPHVAIAFHQDDSRQGDVVFSTLQNSIEERLAEIRGEISIKTMTIYEIEFRIKKIKIPELQPLSETLLAFQRLYSRE